METKNQIRSRIDELTKLKEFFLNTGDLSILNSRIEHLEGQLKLANEDMATSVSESHKVLCTVKNMDENAAFGHDPAVFYSSALSGECGELLNNLIKVIRSGGSKEQKKEAIASELADVFIYAILLAKTNGIDCEQIVADKTKIVIERSLSGYYGGPLK